MGLPISSRSCRFTHRRKKRFITAGFPLVVLAAALACSGPDEGRVLPNEQLPQVPDGYRLLARLAHISDAQIVDEQSPARVTPVDGIINPAWRPHEAYSTQLLDGIIRAINRRHEQNGVVDFVVCTGDATDNKQANEWRWFLDVFDGRRVDPTSGPDDRLPDDLPPAELDPHAPFTPAGLYRRGIHGPLPSIPWYTLVGNHDRFAQGNFAVFEFADGSRLAPLPFVVQLALFFPAFLNPEGALTFGLITPAHPGPPVLLNLPQAIQPNAERRYTSTDEVVAAHFDTLTQPPGHGFTEPIGESTWYSVSPVPGLRLIALDTALPEGVFAAVPYVAGSLTATQLDFLATELREAQTREEWVIVASHHPSQNLLPPGTAVNGEQLRELLSSFPNVLMHLVGHFHRNHVTERAGYLEIETASIIDYPQEGRIIEIWQNAEQVLLRYWTFSHLVDDVALRDELHDLRLEAFELARADAHAAVATARRSMGGDGRDTRARDCRPEQWLEGQPRDRVGQVILSKPR